VLNTESTMPFAAAISTRMRTSEALDEVCAKAAPALGGQPDLALAFLSRHHVEDAAGLATGLQQRLEPTCLAGCQGEAIVGDEREVENAPALALWLARWSRPVRQTVFHLTFEETSEGPGFLGWPDEFEHVRADESILLLLADPFSFPADEFLERVEKTVPGLRVVGGMSSGPRMPGEAVLFARAEVKNAGGVAVLLEGGPAVRSVVSQGCRPIGKHMIITKAKENLILELGGKPALERLQKLWEELSQADQELIRQGLHIGRVVSEYRGEFQRGDFLIRNAIGFDRGSGAIAISDRVRVGQTVQFHVRDRLTADQDLHELLQLDLAAHDARPAAALLFTCNGRGTRLFDAPDHDAGVLRAEAGPIPLAGFFAQGELGPVCGQNFIHGFTASVVLFEE
jgi:small ligand-binding sensory domain FIST